ncbi:hypothetical protein HNQ91_002269 [Filimonas zeae]|uniref:hypothetical protein n=1 Tax=Filimonas zeae TaxID=1737353 RepID=UPI001668914E|nr:hypothetical protein [Filimonas zeae]MDR6339218.1 hypothetical protein [Filimonas zeae]
MNQKKSAALQAETILFGLGYLYSSFITAENPFDIRCDLEKKIDTLLDDPRYKGNDKVVRFSVSLQGLLGNKKELSRCNKIFFEGGRLHSFSQLRCVTHFSVLYSPCHACWHHTAGIHRFFFCCFPPYPLVFTFRLLCIMLLPERTL